MDFKGRWQRFRQRMVIVGPPLVLLIVGAATFIVVSKLAQSDLPIIGPQSLEATRSAEPQSPATTTLTTISTAVAKPTATEISIMQSEVTAGHNVWRLDPLQAAKRQAVDYGFIDRDPFTLLEVEGELAAGPRRIEAQHNGRSYQIVMYQPGEEGPEGIWLIESISALEN